MTVEAQFVALLLHDDTAQDFDSRRTSHHNTLHTNARLDLENFEWVYLGNRLSDLDKIRTGGSWLKVADTSDLAFSDDTFHLSFQQWVTHKGNYRPRSKTVTQLSASKFFGRKSKKSLPRPFLDVILREEFDSGLEMGLRSLPVRQIWLFQTTHFT